MSLIYQDPSTGEWKSQGPRIKPIDPGVYADWLKSPNNFDPSTNPNALTPPPLPVFDPSIFSNQSSGSSPQTASPTIQQLLSQINGMAKTTSQFGATGPNLNGQDATPASTLGLNWSDMI